MGRTFFHSASNPYLVWTLQSPFIQPYFARMIGLSRPQQSLSIPLVSGATCRPLCISPSIEVAQLTSVNRFLGVVLMIQIFLQVHDLTRHNWLENKNIILSDLQPHCEDTQILNALTPPISEVFQPSFFVFLLLIRP